MKCPHCPNHFADNWSVNHINWRNAYALWDVRISKCAACGEFVMEFKHHSSQNWKMIFPIGANRGPVPTEVPVEISNDYKEACSVLPHSAKAAAALARRCLQAILQQQGYADRDLSRQIDAILQEPDPKKAIPGSLRETIDAIRNFGNFSAHQITDQTTLQIIDVQPDEAEWCLEIIEGLFDHYYVRPAQTAAKKAALDAKLKAAGKPPSK